MKKALITGITGFAGSFLAENLVNTGNYEVSGTYLSDESLINVVSLKGRVNLHKLDLQDSKMTEALIAAEKPEFVFHLAALASAAESFKDPASFISNNIGVQVNVLEGIRKAGILPRVLITSSAEVYGNVDPSNLPTNENAPLQPVNPYSVSKVSQDFLGLQYFLSYRIPIIRIRPFNHIGPRQAPTFVVSSFAKKIADIEKGKTQPVMMVGNLTAKRDFTDVRDISEGYRLLLENGVPGEVYNIGSGKSYDIKYILNTLLSFSSVNIKVQEDPSLIRPVDVKELLCDNKKMKKATNWEPKIPIETTLRETLDYWRAQP